ncbi:MAG TPA: 30S ribosomal protein S2 [Spirochaetota bacterium]|nr:30S ribosomal protein S2 [Spirochaetota bacterium]
MEVVSMKALLESGVHFGHQTRRWNPKMSQFIFTARNGIHIIDLQKTMQRVKVAYSAMRDLSSNGGKILFVGTKKQAQGAIVEYAEKCGMYYVSERWLGGLLTNFKTVNNSIQRLKELERMQENDSWDAETKKEILELQRELGKKNKILSGIKNMATLPDALFIIDPKRETIAVQEAQKLGIPIFAVVDTNCNPDDIDYPIPGNDDAIRAIALFLEVMAKAIVEGQSGGQSSDIAFEDEDGAPVAAAADVVEDEADVKEVSKEKDAVREGEQSDQW